MRSITDFSVKHAVSVYVLLFILVVGGFVAYTGLPREAAPDIEIPVVLVTTPYIGVSPEDIESLVTHPLEQELKEVKDLDELRSTSAEGASIITVKFTTKVDSDTALQNVREKVDLAMPKLPKDAETPILQAISTSDFPVMIVNITGGYDLAKLRDVAEHLQDRIKDVPGVLDAKLAGGLEREIQINVDPVRLDYHGLSLNDVVGAIERENVNVPGGDVKVGDASFLVRVPGEFRDVSKMKDIIVKLRGDHPVYLRDVAEVVDGYKERGSISRLDGTENISLSITKAPGENLLKLADDVKQVLADEGPDLPYGTGVVILGDRSEDIHSMVRELENNMLSGLLLVVGVIMLVMGFRNSLLVGVAIPLSMLTSFIVLAAMGITLNMIVLFSLILALGMLVDNAIVIIENIYRHAGEGKSPVRAALDGTAEVAWPVATSTFTTVAAFVPLLFWPGVEGKFMGYLPMTLIITLLASLFVALIINPVLAASFLRVKGASSVSEPEAPGFWARLATRSIAGYQRLLKLALTYRMRTMVTGAVVFVLTFVLFGISHLGVEFFPSTTPKKVSIDVDAGDGTRLEVSDGIAHEIEGFLRASPNVEHEVASVGAGSGESFISGKASVPHKSRISVDFVDESAQTESTLVTIEHLRDAMLDIPGATFEIKKEQMGPPSGAPITLEVYGDDFDELGKLAQQIRERIRSIPGLVDLRDDYTVGRPEIQVDIDRERAKLVNASTSVVASTVRTAINGTKASVYRDGDDEYDITVRLDAAHRQSLADVEGLRINVASRNNPNVTYLVPIREVAHLVSASGTGSIRHKDTKRVVTIEANNEGRLADDILSDVKAELAGMTLPRGYAVDVAGQQKNREKTQAFLGNAFLIAIFLIGLILVTQFNSITLPGIILAAVVMSLIGVLWGQLVTRLPFGIIMTGLGVISLAGIVVNNGIVLVDFIQQLRAHGHSREEALMQAGLVRLRPVMLTAVTTMLGLLPMAFGVSIDFFTLSVQVGGQSAEFWRPMAVAVIFGLAVATLLTLVVVPVLYSLTDDAEAWVRRLLARPDGAMATLDSPSPPKS